MDPQLEPGFMPAVHQDTPLTSGKEPIRYLANRSVARQRETLDFLYRRRATREC